MEGAQSLLKTYIDSFQTNFEGLAVHDHPGLLCEDLQRLTEAVNNISELPDDACSAEFAKNLCSCLESRDGQTQQQAAAALAALSGQGAGARALAQADAAAQARPHLATCLSRQPLR